MKIIYNLLAALFYLTIPNSCERVSKEPIQITYSLKFLSEETCRVLIIYKDSAEYISLYTDNDWSKDAYIHGNNVASLLIIPQLRYIQNTASTEISDIFDKEKDILLAGQITHNNKTIRYNSRDHINITLTPGDIKRAFN